MAGLVERGGCSRNFDIVVDDDTANTSSVEREREVAAVDGPDVYDPASFDVVPNHGSECELANELDPAGAVPSPWKKVDADEAALEERGVRRDRWECGSKAAEHAGMEWRADADPIGLGKPGEQVRQRWFASSALHLDVPSGVGEQFHEINQRRDIRPCPATRFVDRSVFEGTLTSKNRVHRHQLVVGGCDHVHLKTPAPRGVSEPVRAECPGRCPSTDVACVTDQHQFFVDVEERMSGVVVHHAWLLCTDGMAQIDLGTQSGPVRRLDIALFGATAVRLDGSTVDLGRRQVRRLATILAANAGARVSSDLLIDHLWSTSLPENPRQALNVVLSRLRSALGDASDRLRADRDGYCLLVDAIDIDLFVEAFERARPLTGDEACAALGAALELWTDEPFADEADSEMLHGRRAKLTELHWFAVTRRTELLIESGDPDSAAAVSAPLVGQGAVRERLVIAHARALALSGRKSEALAVIAAATSELRSVHGLEPSQALVVAEHEILDGAVELGAVDVRARRPATEFFVGRQRELQSLAAVRPGRSISLVAEAGMGKSALLDHHLSERDRSHFVRVDVSRRPERPLDSVARLCLDLMARAGINSLDGVDVEFRAALSRICPEYATARSVALTRDSLVDDLARFIERAADAAVLIIDDAHWLDGGSVDVFARLVARGRVAIIFGLRPTDDPGCRSLVGIGAPPAIGGADDELATRCVAHWLEPITRDDVSVLARSILGRSISEVRVDSLLAASGGNALFIRLLLDRWADGGATDTELPSSVLVAVSERLAGLSGAALETLDIAATIGPRFELHSIRQLRPNADADLEAAAEAGVVVVDSSADIGTFLHALVADVCYQLLAPARRLALHDQVGRTLEFGGAAAPYYARHYVEAASLDPHRAVWASIEASTDFVTGFDWLVALEHLDKAAVVIEEYAIDDLSARAHVSIRRGTVKRAIGETEYVEDLAIGCGLARDAGDLELFAVGVIELCGHGMTTLAGGIDERVVGYLNEALLLDLEGAVRAELCAAALPLFSTSNEAERGRALFHEAWTYVRGSDDVDLEAAVIAHAHLGFSHPDDFDLLVEASDRMTSLAGNDPSMIWEAAFVRFQCAVVSGDPTRAHEAVDVMRLFTPLVVRRRRDFGMAFTESAHAALSGDFKQAELAADEALRVGLERFDPSWATSVYGLLLLTIREQQSRLPELADSMRHLRDSRPDYLPFLAVSARVADAAGDLENARRYLDAVAANHFVNIVPDLHYTAVLTLIGPVVATLGTPGEIVALRELLTPFSGRMSWNGASSNGPVDSALAVLARAAGDDELSRQLQSSSDALVESFRTSSERGPVHTSMS